MNLENFFQRPVASLFGLFAIIFLSQIWGEIFMMYYRMILGKPDCPDTALKVGFITTLILVVVAYLFYRFV